MKLEPTQRQIVTDLIAEAHESCGGVTSNVKRAVAEGLLDLERFGHAWVGEYVLDLIAAGCGNIYADWRRAAGIEATTSRGASVLMHGYGSVRETNADGETIYRQMRFEDMDLSQLRDHREVLVANRDTLSRQITLVSDVIAAMEADASLATAGDALRRLAA